MTPTQQIIAGLASLLVMMFVVDLVRRRKLREEYSMLWLAAGALMIVMALDRAALFWLATALGIEHPAYALFVVAIFVGMVLAIHFTVVLSKLTAQTWRLTQEIGLLRTELDELRTKEDRG
ncbi:MAG: DUF2304 domain-containing protein [Armatimonadetes bacterium]|nr:DUF2304 domain-containing protein [Armatimonadota bacterium]